MFILSALAAFKGAVLGSLLSHFLPSPNKEECSGRPHKPSHGRPDFGHGHHSRPTFGPVLSARPQFARPHHYAPLSEIHQSPIHLPTPFPLSR